MTMTPKRGIAIAATTAALCGLGVTSTPIAFAQDSGAPQSQSADIDEAIDKFTAELPFDLPQDASVNFDINKLRGDVQPVLTLLRDASDDASRLLNVNLDNGAISSIIDGLRDAVGGGSSPSLGSSDRGSILDRLGLGSGNKDDKPGSGGSKFDPTDLPDFVEENPNGTLTADTTGVKPGEYKIEGTLTTPDGGKQDVLLSFNVSEPSGGDSSGDDADADGGDTDNDAGDGNTDGGNTDGGSTPGGGSGDNSGGDNDQSDGQVQGEVSYPDTKVAAGESTEVKPDKAPEDVTFMNGMPDENWVKVSRDGTVTLSPESGMSEGDKTVTVAYVANEDVKEVLRGDDSVIKTTDFTAHVTKKNSSADATERNSGSGSGSMQNASNSTGGDSRTSTTDDTDSSSGTGGGSVEPGGAGASPQNRGAAEDFDDDTGPAAGTVQDTGAEPVGGPAQTQPQAQAQAGEEALPVTGVNARSMGVVAALALGMIAAGAVMIRRFAHGA